MSKQETNRFAGAKLEEGLWRIKRLDECNKKEAEYLSGARSNAVGRPLRFKDRDWSSARIQELIDGEHWLETKNISFYIDDSKINSDSWSFPESLIIYEEPKSTAKYPKFVGVSITDSRWRYKTWEELTQEQKDWYNQRTDSHKLLLGKQVLVSEMTASLRKLIEGGEWGQECKGYFAKDSGIPDWWWVCDWCLTLEPLPVKEQPKPKSKYADVSDDDPRWRIKTWEELTPELRGYFNTTSVREALGKKLKQHDADCIRAITKLKESYNADTDISLTNRIDFITPSGNYDWYNMPVGVLTIDPLPTTINIDSIYNNYRFKTEQELIDSLGGNWKSELRYGWSTSGDKATFKSLLGKAIKECFLKNQLQYDKHDNSVQFPQGWRSIVQCLTDKPLPSGQNGAQTATTTESRLDTIYNTYRVKTEQELIDDKGVNWRDTFPHHYFPKFDDVFGKLVKEITAKDKLDLTVNRLHGIINGEYNVDVDYCLTNKALPKPVKDRPKGNPTDYIDHMIQCQTVSQCNRVLELLGYNDSEVWLIDVFGNRCKWAYDSFKSHGTGYYVWEIASSMCVYVTRDTKKSKYAVLPNTKHYTWTYEDWIANQKQQAETESLLYRGTEQGMLDPYGVEHLGNGVYTYNPLANPSCEIPIPDIIQPDFESVSSANPVTSPEREPFDAIFDRINAVAETRTKKAEQPAKPKQQEKKPTGLEIDLDDF